MSLKRKIVWTSNKKKFSVKSELAPERKCDCWKHEFQVCDTCQGDDGTKPECYSIPLGTRFYYFRKNLVCYLFHIVYLPVFLAKRQWHMTKTLGTTDGSEELYYPWQFRE